VALSDLRLVALDAPLLDAALDGPRALEHTLGIAVVDGWDLFPRSLARMRRELDRGGGTARWGSRLFVAGDPPAVVGWGGFKGPPREGTVELGYAIAPARQGRGLATAAVRALLAEAFADPDVRAVIAHTLPEPGPSPRVLEKAGFALVGEATVDGGRSVWRFRILDAALPA
jgi:[ribosomal protein S5]-alanine N-acetyltransferase